MTSVPRWWLPLVLVVHGVCALIYTQIIPVDRGPDEPHHLLYIEHFEKFGDLPRLTSATTARDDRDGAIAIHPPLYYAACWPLYHLVRHASHARIQMVFRFVALLLAWGTLTLCWRLFRRVFPDEPHVALLALVCVALLPEFLLLSAVQNNDGAMMLVSTWAALALVERLDANGSVRDWALLGLLFAATVITKAIGVALLPLPLLLLVKQARDHGWDLRAGAARAAAYLSGPLLVDAWWFIRNKHYAGHFHPIYRWTNLPLTFDSPIDFLVGGQKSWMCLQRFLVGAQQSQLGQVDWFLPRAEFAHAVAFPLTLRLYWLMTLLEFAALAGLVWLARREWRAPRLTRSQQYALGLAAGLFTLQWLALLHFTLFVHPGGYRGGRYLLPAVASWALLFAVGLLGPLAARWRPWVIGGVTALLLVWNLGCMANQVGVLNPTYAPGVGVELNLGWQPPASLRRPAGPPPPAARPGAPVAPPAAAGPRPPG